MAHRVGPRGEVVIPKEIRDELGIEPGDEVNFWLDGDQLKIRRVRRRPELRGRFRGSDLTAQLERSRREDR